MKAKIIGFKGSRRDTYNKGCILKVEDKNPPSFIGRKVFWKTASGRAIQGKIVRTHGKGALLARFKKGIPGFAVGDELEFRAPSLPKPEKVARKVEKPKAVVKKAKPPAKKPAPKKKAAPAKPAKKDVKAKSRVKKAEVKKKPAPKKKAETKEEVKPPAKKKAPARKKPAPKKTTKARKKPATKKKTTKKAAK